MKRSMVGPGSVGGGIVGLAPPRSPIDGAMTYEQAALYASGWWPNWLMNRVAVVGACVRLIAHQIGVLPGSVQRDGVEVPDQPGWLRNPAPNLYGWFGDALEQIVTSLLMRGNAYLVATGIGSNNYPLGWIVATPDGVTIDYESGRAVYRWGDTALTADEVTHIKWLAIPGNPYGVSPLEAAWNELCSAASLSSYAANLATSGAMPYGMLSTDQRLSSGQATALQNQMATTGTTRRGVLVLDSGLHYTQLQLSPKDMALLEIAEFDARAICSVFGVPPWLVNIPMADGLTYSTVEGQKDSLLTFTLDPILSKIEGGISYSMLPGDRALRFDRDRFTLPPFLTRMQGYETGIRAGVLLPNEAREDERLPPLETDATAAGVAVAPPNQGVTQ